MSRYIVRVIYPDGTARFLMRGKLTDRQVNATHYAHPSNARQAEERFMARRGSMRGPVYTDVVDTRDEERTV